MPSGVYVIQNTLNGKRYIGSAADIDGRMHSHRVLLNGKRHHNQHLQGAWLKYGDVSFVCHPLLVCSIENLLFYEQTCIDALHPEYNIALVAGAPMRNRKHSQKSCLKMKGRKPSPKRLVEMSRLLVGNTYRVGIKHTEETRRKMHEAAQRSTPEERKARATTWTGKTHTKETKEKIADALRGNKNGVGNKANVGRNLSEEHKSKIRKHRHDAETRARMSLAVKEWWAKRKQEKIDGSAII